jgi:hypothetical protein
MERALPSRRWFLVIVLILLLRRYKIDANESAPFFAKVSATLTYITLALILQNYFPEGNHLIRVGQPERVFCFILLGYSSALELQGFARTRNVVDALSCIVAMICILVSGDFTLHNTRR